LLVHHLTFRGNFLISAFWGDIAATVIVWFFGVYYKNSSLYDPYWSVAPLMIIPFWVVIRQSPLDATVFLFLIAVFVWGIRLTLNWAVRWSGLKHQDWRYTQLKEQSPRWWFLVNLTGINLMPTLLVFGGMVPVYVALFHGGPNNLLLLWLGFCVCIGAVLLQTIADKQMDIFKKRSGSKESYIEEGVWRYSRHPNYFGEILFWWGLWIMQLGVNSVIWYTVAGPILMTLLFAFISIPLMEKHILASKPTYADYQGKVSILVPWPRRGQGIDGSPSVTG